jgi:hypothetical protein
LSGLRLRHIAGQKFNKTKGKSEPHGPLSLVPQRVPQLSVAILGDQGRSGANKGRGKKRAFARDIAGIGPTVTKPLATYGIARARVKSALKRG